MANAKVLVERARMFEERAEKATDPISRQHYREMAAHYRTLSVEHQNVVVETSGRGPLDRGTERLALRHSLSAAYPQAEKRESAQSNRDLLRTNSQARPAIGHRGRTR